MQLQTNIQYAAGIAEAFAIVAGVSLILFGIAGLKRYAEMRGMMGQQHSMAKPLMLLICGSIIVSFANNDSGFCDKCFCERTR